MATKSDEKSDEKKTESWTLSKGDMKRTVTVPRERVQMQAEGWSLVTPKS